MVDFLRRFRVWAGNFGVPARGPRICGFLGCGQEWLTSFLGVPAAGRTPVSGFLVGGAGMVDFLRRFLVWADDFGVPASVGRRFWGSQLDPPSPNFWDFGILGSQLGCPGLAAA